MAAVADQRSWAQLVAPSRWQVYVQTDEGHSVYYTCRYLVIYTLYNSPVYNIFKSPNTNTNSACIIPVTASPFLLSLSNSSISRANPQKGALLLTFRAFHLG